MKTAKNIWIIDPYSEKPNPDWRDGRYYLIAKALSDNGFKVHLFISNFSHRTKEKDTNLDAIHVNSNFTVVIVPTIGYKHHISFNRIRYEKTFAKNIAENKQKIPSPSFIIVKEPAVFMFSNLRPLIKASNAKVIIDIMDLWPELFELKIPIKLRWLGKIIFYPLYYKRRKIINYASAITAVAPDYLETGININSTVPSKVIYWGCNVTNICNLMESNEDGFLSKLNLPSKENNIWGIYAGTLGESYDMMTLVEAAKVMRFEAPNLKFLIAGAGPMAEKIETSAVDSENIYYLGSLPTKQLYQLFKFCDFGFSTYSDASPVSMPIKCYDYFAAGLPLVNSLKRNLGALITERELGYQYDASDCNSLVSALKTLVSSPERLNSMKLKCKAISNEFNDAEQYNKFVLLLKELTV